MSFLKKLLAKGDGIPPPYSTIYTILFVTAFPIYILYASNSGKEIGFAIGVIVGCIVTIIFKWSLESSDKAHWSKLKKLLGFRNG